jgi:RNA polymerase sigma-70 factor (ECF subfamily)
VFVLATDRKLLPVAAVPSRAEGPPVPPDFDALYASSVRDVARWAARLAGPSVDPADVVQEVFIVAHRRLDSLHAGIKPSTWLFGITRRVARSEQRKQRLWRWLYGNGSDSLDDFAFLGPTPIEQLEQRRAQLQVYRALDRMKEKYRTAFILFELEGRTTQEIADLLDAKLATVKVWLHRARAQFVTHAERGRVCGPR